MKFRPLLIAFLLLLFSLSCTEVNNLNLFSVEQDVELGKQLRSEVLNDPQQFPMLPRAQYPQAYEYVESVVADIMNSGNVEHAKDFPWEVYIINDDNTLNAFAAPGGFIFVYTGLIKFLEQKDDFA
ncbi:MAG: M48 family metalloprotease, partial [Saprospiraceae bacterium]